MPRSLNYLLFAGLLICLHQVSAQKRTPYAVWLFPAVSWHPAKNVRLVGQLGYNHYLRTGIFFPQGFITVNKHIILNPAYIYAIQKRDGNPTVQEHYIMTAIIFQAGYKNFLADTRNMLWNRFSNDMTARHYYRNRLRLTQSFKPSGITTRVYAYDEVFYLFNQGTLARNRIAAGVSCDITPHVNTDVTCIRQWDRYSGNLNLFFVTGTWQF